jgi:predicted permease
MFQACTGGQKYTSQHHNVASSAVAAMVTQFAQLYDKEPGYASVINVMSVLLCIITMPLLVALYQLF